MKRSTAAEVAQDTLRILTAGHYTSPTGQTVPIAEDIARAVQGTRSCPPESPLPTIAAGSHSTCFEVTNASTLDVARRLADSGERPVALNFASAKHPGGGFRTGARAQEESLARASALFSCLNGNPMYAFHQDQSDPMYSCYAIYSPDVPVFRDDEGALLEKPYLCSFITSPAVNAGVVLQRRPGSEQEIRTAMQARVHKVLTLAATHGHPTLILGAWGCGVFRNDSKTVAELFADALRDTFPGVFSHVVFAVLDSSPERRFIGPFEDLFRS